MSDFSQKFCRVRSVSSYTMVMTDMDIVVRNLRQGYGRQLVLQDFDLKLSTGVFGLLGPNGVGKTTLLRTLATVAPPQKGSIRLLGRDTSDARQLREIRRRLGFLPQRLGYFPGFTVREFVEYSAWLREVPVAEIPKKTATAIDAVDLTSVTDKKLKNLSGGTLRRVGIAQAIVNEPELLILDEPTSGLDPEQRASFRKLLRIYGEKGIVIVATHLVEDVATACNDVAIMYGGRFAFRGLPEDLARTGTPEALGDTPIERAYTTLLAQMRKDVP